MKTLFLSIVFGIVLINPINLIAQGTNEIYKNGSVWDVSMINIEVDVKEEFLEILEETWEYTMRNALEQELIKSYNILIGDASNEKDYNIVLMVENEKLGDYDPDPVRDAKWNLIKQEMISRVGGTDKYNSKMKRYKQIRRLLNEKNLRQIHLKPKE